MELSLSEIARVVGGRLVGDGEKRIRDVAPFEAATEDQITFADGAKFLKRIKGSAAGAFVVPLEFEEDGSKNLLKVKNPRAAFAQIMKRFHPSSVPTPGISPHSVIGRDFRHGQEVSIAPLAYIGDRVTFGDRVVVQPGVVIGTDVLIGDDVLIYSNVTILERCRLGNRVIIHSGTVIGSDGYGFVPQGETYVKIPQIGIVQIDDDVEIGAGNTIDRATFGRTWIQSGVKTDNQVHVGHNVTVGENTVLVAQVVIAGSTTIGKHVIVAGGAAIAGHLTIGDNAIIGPRAGVAKSVPAGQIVSGAPEMPHRQWLKMSRVLPELPEIRRKLRTIEKQQQAMMNRSNP